MHRNTNFRYIAEIEKNMCKTQYAISKLQNTAPSYTVKITYVIFICAVLSIFSGITATILNISPRKTTIPLLISSAGTVMLSAFYGRLNKINISIIDSSVKKLQIALSNTETALKIAYSISPPQSLHKCFCTKFCKYPEIDRLVDSVQKCARISDGIKANRLITAYTKKVIEQNQILIRRCSEIKL